MQYSFIDTLVKIWEMSVSADLTWQHLGDDRISGVLIYLAIVKGFEPLFVSSHSLRYAFTICRLPILWWKRLRVPASRVACFPILSRG